MNVSPSQPLFIECFSERFFSRPVDDIHQLTVVEDPVSRRWQIDVLEERNHPSLDVLRQKVTSLFKEIKDYPSFVKETMAGMRKRHIQHSRLFVKNLAALKLLFENQQPDEEPDENSGKRKIVLIRSLKKGSVGKKKRPFIIKKLTSCSKSSQPRSFLRNAFTI